MSSGRELILFGRNYNFLAYCSAWGAATELMARENFENVDFRLNIIVLVNSIKKFKEMRTKLFDGQVCRHQPAALNKSDLGKRVRQSPNRKVVFVTK